MDVPENAVAFLSARGLKLATAESCTAGYIASLVSSVPGSGSCLDVGFVTYSPSGKAGFLGVQEETMKQFGLTSEEVAREMSEGALKQEACCADVAVSNTGVRISDEGDRPFRDRDRRFRQRDRPFRERDRTDRRTGLALRMTSTTRAMLAGFCRREHARAPDEHAHDQGRFTT
ncbi:CinA family protein [Caballeronia sp. LZ008]|uniref:CinA family protein n=1 Tax=Caballeronia sp. LZ008 TaxID=3038560 RepID=UPI0038D39AE7